MTRLIKYEQVIYFEMEPENYGNEIEYIQDVVSRYFPVYKTEVEFDIVSVYIKTSVDEDLEDRFDKVRKKMVPENFIPYLVEENGEYIIKIRKQRERKFRTVKANIVMLFITIGTTLIAGAWWWASYTGGDMFSLHNLSRGALYFTLPLMTILGTHEMGHYLMAKRHGIKASLPFFLPMAPPLGTIGAFISIREPIPDKKSLMDVGIAGPIAGFIVAIPVTIIGLYLAGTTPYGAPLEVDGLRQIFNYPIIMIGMSRLMDVAHIDAMHPTLFAGWVGFLVTGLNLIPASQLDGGHVVRALFGEKAKYISYIAFAFFVIMGITLFLGYLVLAFILLFIGGVKHPPPLNDLTKLDKKRVIVGGVAILLLFMTLHPIPVEQEEFSYEFDVRLKEGEEPERELLLGEYTNYSLVVENQAENVDIDDGIDYEIDIDHSENWTVELFEKSENETWIEADHDLNLEKGDEQEYRLHVSPTENITEMENEITFEVSSYIRDEVQRKREVMTTSIGYGFDVEYDRLSFFVENENGEFDFNLTNIGKEDNYTIIAEIMRVETEDERELSKENWSINLEKEEEYDETLEPRLEFSEVYDFKAVLRRDDNDLDQHVVVYFEVTIRSGETGEEETFELWGVQIIQTS